MAQRVRAGLGILDALSQYERTGSDMRDSYELPQH